MTEPQEIPPYSCLGELFFWGLWLLGLSVCLAYILALVFLMQSTKTDLASVFSSVFSTVFAAWNLLAIGAQGYLLVQSVRLLIRHEETISELIFRPVFVVFGIPMIASGGCFILFSFAPRVAG